MLAICACLMNSALAYADHAVVSEQVARLLLSFRFFGLRILVSP